MVIRFIIFCVQRINFFMLAVDKLKHHTSVVYLRFLLTVLYQSVY